MSESIQLFFSSILLPIDKINKYSLYETYNRLLTILLTLYLPNMYF